MQNTFSKNNNNNAVIDDISDDNENEEANCYTKANVCRVKSTNTSQQEQEEELSCAEEDINNQCKKNHNMQNERSDGEVKEIHLHPLIAEYVQRRGNYFGTDALVNGGVHTINDHLTSGDAVTRALLRKREGELNKLASLISSNNTCHPNLQEFLTLYNIQQGVDRNLPSADDGIVENVENRETYSINNNNYSDNNNTIKMLTWHAPNYVNNNFTKKEGTECVLEPEENLVNYSTNSIDNSNNDIGLYKRARYCTQEEKEQQQQQENKNDYTHCTRTSLIDDNNNNNNTMRENTINSDTSEVCSIQNTLYYDATDTEEMMPVKRTRLDETCTSINNNNNIKYNTNIIESCTLRDNVSSAAAMPFDAARENNNCTLNQRCNGANIKGKHMKRNREVDNDDDDDDNETEKRNITER